MRRYDRGLHITRGAVDITVNAERELDVRVATLLVDVMSSTSAMAPRWRSRGVATVLAMTSGLAPGNEADTKIAGTSIRGNGATGNKANVAIPDSATPNVSSMVATGRAMKGAEMFTPGGPPGPVDPRSAPHPRTSVSQAGRMRGK